MSQASPFPSCLCTSSFLPWKPKIICLAPNALEPGYQLPKLPLPSSTLPSCSWVSATLFSLLLTYALKNAHLLLLHKCSPVPQMALEMPPSITTPTSSKLLKEKKKDSFQKLTGLLPKLRDCSFYFRFGSGLCLNVAVHQHRGSVRPRDLYREHGHQESMYEEILSTVTL